MRQVFPGNWIAGRLHSPAGKFSPLANFAVPSPGRESGGLSWPTRPGLPRTWTGLNERNFGILALTFETKVDATVA